MSDSTTVRDGFIAMMVHDWCKTVLNADGKWTGHQKFDPQHQEGVAFSEPTERITKDFLKTLFGEDVIREIRHHHDGLNFNSSLVHRIAIGIADRAQKAMYQLQDASGKIILEQAPREEHPAVDDCIVLPDIFDNLSSYPPFYPYYGAAIPRWQPEQAAKLLREAVKTIEGQGLEMHALLEAQRPFRTFPHTTYMPHLSLELHQRFAATLFLLVYKQLQKLKAAGRLFSDLTALKFSVITAIPDPLELFYRLRDVTAYHDAATDLRQDLYEWVFENDCANVPGASAEDNPFEYYTFDGLVLVYDEAQRVLEAIQKSADQHRKLRSLAVEVINYEITLNRDFVSPHHSPEVQRFTILEQQSQVFPTTTLARCQRCNIPVAEPLPSGLCESCETLMQKPSGIENLETVATDETGKTQRLAYVFLTLPEDLHAESARVAQLHLDRMIEDARRLRHPEDPAWADPNLPRLRPTKMGLFEYLEAVLSVESMQREIRKKKPGGVKRIAEFPRLTIYVMREGLFLEFFEILEETTAQMHLDLKIRAILCDLKTPVWSLMDRFTDHPREQERRTLVDTGGGEIVMFTDEEVKAIRELASFEKEVITKSQLHALVKMARRGSLEELKLEVDRRREKSRRFEVRDPRVQKQEQERDRFVQLLKKRLSDLSLLESEALNREKRALFIKNVADLGDFKGQ